MLTRWTAPNLTPIERAALAQINTPWPTVSHADSLREVAAWNQALRDKDGDALEVKPRKSSKAKVGR